MSETHIPRPDKPYQRQDQRSANGLLERWESSHMSVVDHFSQGRKPIFLLVGRRIGRRQFNVSLGLIAALALPPACWRFPCAGPPGSCVQSPVVQADSGSANFGKLVQP